MSVNMNVHLYKCLPIWMSVYTNVCLYECPPHLINMFLYLLLHFSAFGWEGPQFFHLIINITWYIIFNKWRVCGLSCWSKIHYGSPPICNILLSTSFKTLWAACMATSSKDKQIGVYSIALTIRGKLCCTNKKTIKMTYYYYEGTKKQH